MVKLTGKEIEISIEEVRRSELDAQLTAESIAQALERRISFRRAMKQAIGRTMKAGAKGIKVLCSGKTGRERKLPEVKSTVKETFLFTHCAQISTTDLRKRTPPTARSA